MHVGDPVDFAVDLLLFEDLFCQVGKIFQFLVAVLRIMVGDQPPGNFGLLKEIGDVADR